MIITHQSKAGEAVCKLLARTSSHSVGSYSKLVQWEREISISTQGDANKNAIEVGSQTDYKRVLCSHC